MKLIGMLDSPYVRRVAISLKHMNIAFEHQPLSVFSDFDKVAAINPLVKAPTFVTDDGVVLMDSSLILDYAERLVLPQHSLMPAELKPYTQAQKLIGIALIACEKAVQMVYEYNLRPAEKQHQPWLDRVYGQLTTALKLLEQEAQTAPTWLLGDRLMQADVTSFVALRFACGKLPRLIRASDYPALAKLSAQAEATEAFKAFPYPPED